MGFEYTTLGEYAKVQGGFAYKSKDFEASGDHRVLKIKNVRFGVVSYEECAFIADEIANATEAWKTKEGDILISMTGSGPNAPQSLVGRVARVWKNEPEAFINQRVGRLQLKQEGSIHLDYLFYLLSLPSSQNFLVANSSGSANQANISGKTIELLPCPRISFKDSKRVAEIGLALDEKILLNQQANQTLEQMAQALFKSWFVDFDPVVDNALAAGNPIPDELAHRVEVRKKAHALPDFQPLPEHIRNLFPSEFEQTGESTVGIDGWTPKGWHVSTTKDEFDIRGGATPSTKNEDFWDGDIHWTSPKDLSGNNTKVLLETARKITEQGLARISSGLLPKNTVLMSSRAPVGYLALARVPVAINQGYIALICNKRVSPEYAIHFLESRMDEIKGVSGGTTFAEISKKTFKEIKILVPNNIDLIESYSANVRGFFSKVEENERMKLTLSLLRDRLLPKLISGELL